MVETLTHLTDLGTRAQLEVQFAQKIDFIIDQLVYSEFSEEDISTFTETVKTFLKFIDLKQYILDALYDKVKEVANVIKPHDESRYASFQKLLRVVVQLDDQDLIDTLESFFLKDRKIKSFFLLLQEKVSLGRDIKQSEKLFLSALNTYYNLDLDIINEYLEIVGQDKSYMVRRLMDKKMATHAALAKYTTSVSLSDKEGTEQHLVPVIVQEFDGDIQHYMSLCRIVITHRPEHASVMLRGTKYDVRDRFSDFVVKNHLDDTMLIASYCIYLTLNNPEEFERFEKEFISKAKPEQLLTYSRYVLNSNRRKILRRLVDLKTEDSRNEKHLVSFIQYFPEFGALLPML
jgi:hypothetical protein